jgi:hypothetical protein
MLFNYRRGFGFPVDIQPPPDLDRAALYVQAIQDDLCLYDVCRKIVEESKAAGVPVERVYLMSPDEWWSGKRQTQSELNQVVAAGEKLVRDRINTTVMSLAVAPHRPFCRTRIDVETSVRNEALDRIYGDGFAHVLVADGDELWRRGFYARLMDIVRNTQYSAVYAGLIPVVGQPGYPVEDAKDRATCYVQRPHHFVDCRGVAGPKVERPAPEIYHFTATRRSMEEVIQKHRDSGHYDDPSYAMESWIEKVLPNIKPGFRYNWSSGNVGLHMYLKYNVWPSVRHWTPEELKEMPESVLPYLGT